MTCKLQHYTTERLQLRLWDYCITNKIVSMLFRQFKKQTCFLRD